MKNDLLFVVSVVFFTALGFWAGTEFNGLIYNNKCAYNGLYDSFRVTVDYTRTHNEMIAKGEYGIVDPEINTKSFPNAGGGKMTLEMVIVDLPSAYTEQIKKSRLATLGLRMAKFEELLAFGEKYQSEQKNAPIAAENVYLWSESGMNIVTPCLHTAFGKRALSASQQTNNWCNTTSRARRYAAVRTSYPDNYTKTISENWCKRYIYFNPSNEW